MAAPTFVADEVVTAEKMNSLPKGILGYVESTATQTGITTVTQLTGMSVTVTVAASRRIRITCQAAISQVTAASTPTGYIRESSTILGRWGRHTLQAGEADLANGSAIITPTAGSHTYNMAIAVAAGTVTIGPSSTEPNWMLVEDIGAV